jgi:hypothetical protein
MVKLSLDEIHCSLSSHRPDVNIKINTSLYKPLKFTPLLIVPLALKPLRAPQFADLDARLMWHPTPHCNDK